MSNAMKKTLISIIIPVYNEEANIAAAYEAVVKEFDVCNDIDFEIVFTDNHSTDKSFSLLSDIAKRDRRVKVLRFTRNFGFNKSILAGYRHAAGDAAIQIDCDLEDPPALFHDFIRLWRSGHDVVVGVRTRRKENIAKTIVRRSFYAVLNNLSDGIHEVNSGDFRLIDRTILDQLKIIQDPYPFVRGLVSELSINPASVSFSRNNRQFGESKFPLRHLIRLALEGVYAHSTAPLKLASYTGLIITLLMTILTGYYIIAWLLSPSAWPAGFATTTILILFGISLNALFLGIIGEYIARIYQQGRTRPSVVIEKSINIEASGGVYNDKH
ncbi:MAG: glycosyltransferase family 2 protein [Rhodocyclaceae bacterium]|nr:glycosyltransferase family 2 protein [Rhodocyclaceae bacterium]